VNRRSQCNRSGWHSIPGSPELPEQYKTEKPAVPAPGLLLQASRSMPAVVVLSNANSVFVFIVMPLQKRAEHGFEIWS
jgi:hypothetical protein